MKNLKKVLALVIALTMVLSTVAFASYADVDYEADYAGAVELLSALNVLKGDENGNFNPNNTITRAEFAAVVCRCLDLESSASSAAGATAFTDVAADHWAAGYINLATQYGIINGRGNGIFDPNGNVTFAEAVKMLVVAIGYEPMAATKGGYPTGYLTVANSTKMTAGVSAAGANAAALRSTVAQLAANALEIPKMDQVGFGSDTSFEVFDDYDNYVSLLTDMDVFKLTGVITDIDKVKGEVTVQYTQGSEDYEFGYKKNGDEIAFPATETFNLNGSNAADFVQKNVDVYVQKVAKGEYDILFVVPSEIGETLTIDGANLNADGTGKPYATLAFVGDTTTTTAPNVELQYKETKNATKYTKFEVEDSPLVYINGQKVTGLTTLDLTTFSVIEFVENTDDDVFDIVNITIYEHAIVEEVDAAKERINFVGGSYVRFDSEDRDQIVDILDVDGNAIALEDIKAGDVLAMVVHSLRNTTDAVPAKNFAGAGYNNQITIYNLGANTVTGVITEADDANSLVYIDDTEYEVATSFVDGNYTDVVASGAVKLGTEGTFYLSIGGSIIGFDGAAGSNGNYAYILQAAYNTGDAFSAGWQVKMLTADGVATYDLYKNVTLGTTTVASNTLTSSESFFSDYVGATAFNTTPANNVVEYKLATDGTIKSIAVVTANQATLAATSSFNANTNKLANKLLADDVLIFDLTGTDAGDAKITDISALVDDGIYGGEVFDNADGDGHKVFVMTSGTAAFDAEAKFNVVTSVRKTTYDGDDSAVIVKYYTDGIGEELSYIFTTDSNNKNTTNAYSTLKKGDIFVANADAEGVVSDYVVLATVNTTTKSFDVVSGAFAAAYGPEFKSNNLTDGVAYVVTYFKEVKNGVAVFEDGTNADDYGFRIGAGAAAYNFTSSTGSTILEAGDYLGSNIDNAYFDDLNDDNAFTPAESFTDGNSNGQYDAGETYVDANSNGQYDAGETYYGANVIIKLYDGEVTDIYSYNDMVAQTYWN